MLTVEASRAVPHITAVGWDDEGVAPEAFPLIQGGKLMTYLHSRQTAGELGAPQRDAAASHRLGSAVAQTAGTEVLVQTPHLTMAPSASKTSLMDLCKDIPHGILVRSLPYLQTERDLGTGHFNYGCSIFEISRGKLVARLTLNEVVFSTRRLWNGLQAVGDAGTQESAYVPLVGGSYVTMQSVTAPAALFKEVNVVSNK
jgi:TldD protein